MLYNYYGLPVFNTATYGAGTNPCRLVMQNNGLLSILDATTRVIKTLSSAGPAYTTGVLLSRQELVQVILCWQPLCSAVGHKRRQGAQAV